MAGWVKIRRNMPDWLWGSETKLKWYIDLLLMASVKDTERVMRLQVDMTMRQLAKRWGVSVTRISRFLKALDAEDMIILCEEEETLQKPLQRALQKPLQIIVRDFSELRNTALQRALQKPLQRALQNPKEKERTKEKENYKEVKEKETLQLVYNNKLLYPNRNEKKDDDFSSNGKEEASERYTKFMAWVAKTAPWCNDNLKPMDEVKFYTLLQRFGADNLKEVIMALENSALRTKYKDMYLTALNWLKIRERNSNGTIRQGS